MTATLTLVQEGDKLTGTLTGERGRETPLTGKVKGSSISFRVKRETPRGEMTVEYTGKVEGNSIKETMEMGQFSLPWSAKREAEPPK